MVSPENSHSQWQIAVFPDPKPQILKKPLSLRKTSPQGSNEKKIKILFRHRSMEMGGVEKVMLSLMHNLDPEKFEISQSTSAKFFWQTVKKIFPQILLSKKFSFSTEKENSTGLEKTQLLSIKKY